MQYTLNEARQALFQKVYSVYDIFKDFFGEKHTDLQGIPDNDLLKNAFATHNIDTSAESYTLTESQLCTLRRYFPMCAIMVWWPRVTVSNENNRSVVIYDLYAKVTITADGRIPYEQRGFQLNRSTFPEDQFSSGYCHSHVPSFSSIPRFANPCLGSGPINRTIMTLRNECDEPIWMLFCQELALYVTVESLRGGPYIHMEYIGSKNQLVGYDDYENTVFPPKLYSFYTNSKKEEFYSMLKSFMAYYLENGHLSINYTNGHYVPGMPYFDFMIDISNAFIDFYNIHGSKEGVKELKDKKVIITTLAANGKFYNIESVMQNDFSQYEGTTLFSFKGKDIKLHINRNIEAKTETTILLNHKIAMYILINIIRTINCRYRNEHNGEYSSTAPTYQAVCYI